QVFPRSLAQVAALAGVHADVQPTDMDSGPTSPELEPGQAHEAKVVRAAGICYPTYNKLRLIPLCDGAIKQPRPHERFVFRAIKDDSCLLRESHTIRRTRVVSARSPCPAAGCG